jgi:transitional endoplasmic reticulum ATPase
MATRVNCRPGRLELQIPVPLPDEAGRLEILEIHTRHVKLHPSVLLATFAARTAGWSGADLANLCREAAMEALRANISAGELQQHHFDDALKTLSLTKG